MLRCEFDTEPVPLANDKLYARLPWMWLTGLRVKPRSTPFSVAKSTLRKDAKLYGFEGTFCTCTRSRTSL